MYRVTASAYTHHSLPIIHLFFVRKPSREDAIKLCQRRRLCNDFCIDYFPRRFQETRVKEEKKRRSKGRSLRNHASGSACYVSYVIARQSEIEEIAARQLLLITCQGSRRPFTRVFIKLSIIRVHNTKPARISIAQLMEFSSREFLQRAFRDTRAATIRSRMTDAGAPRKLVLKHARSARGKLFVPEFS